MNLEFARAVSVIPSLFDALAKSSPLLEKGTISQKGKAGVYAFFEKGHPVHVGRTKNLQGRLRGHATFSHYSASFAFKRARRVMNMKATYKSEGSRSALAKHEVFGPEFKRQVASVKAMEVRFIEVADPVTQYLLELYAHMEWKLPMDEFQTH
jgi:hypothetical protein